MAFKRKTYDEIRNGVISHITKGIVNERHTFNRGQTSYRLADPSATRIVKIDGLSDGQETAFREDVDYRLNEGSVQWTPGGEKPDEDTAFEVNYSIGEERAITDANPGSVVRTIVEAVSREMDYMYAQLEQVYEAGFIDTATGSSLDLVASILGVTRKPAEPAMGVVTFGRNTPPPEIAIENEAHMGSGKDVYELKVAPVKAIVKVEGTSKGVDVEFRMDEDYVLDEGRVRWLPDGSRPDPNSTFSVDYTGYEKIQVPRGVRVSNYARRAEDTRSYETMEEKTLEPLPNGKWEAQVRVKALDPGVSGNVFAGSLVVMPQPLMGIEYVINRGDILSGDMPEEVSGVVKVIAQGGSDEEIRAVIDDTRAAGIKVEFSRPKIVNISVNMTVTHGADASPSRLRTLAEEKIRTYISSLDIGDDVVYHRIVNSTLQVEGIYDVAELTLTASRPGAEPVTSTRANIAITAEEMALPYEVNILLKERTRRG
jgi:uncharacterized alkaline shock family protein YloU